MGKIAIITGIAGQDGSYLSELLLSKNANTSLANGEGETVHQLVNTLIQGFNDIKLKLSQTGGKRKGKRKRLTKGKKPTKKRRRSRKKN